MYTKNYYSIQLLVHYYSILHYDILQGWVELYGEVNDLRLRYFRIINFQLLNGFGNMLNYDWRDHMDALVKIIIIIKLTHRNIYGIILGSMCSRSLLYGGNAQMLHKQLCLRFIWSHCARSKRDYRHLFRWIGRRCRQMMRLERLPHSSGIRWIEFILNGFELNDLTEAHFQRMILFHLYAKPQSYQSILSMLYVAGNIC